jgi:hypothetical protein
VFKPLRPTPVSGCLSAMLFRLRYRMLVWSVIVVLSGLLASASAQDKPADSQPGTLVATGQTLSGDSPGAG